MKTNEFIAVLAKSNFSLAVEDEKLILKGDKNKVTKEQTEAIKKNNFVINYIKDNKEELIEYITSLKDSDPGKKSKDISSIYRLSGLQQGMLFHGLYDEKAGSYSEQLSCDLINPDLDIITKSWKNIISKHSILRSGYYYDDFSVPVQCVYREVELPLTVLDYSDMDPEDKTGALKVFEKEDRFRGFDFKAAPLMRITLIRLSDERYKMYWTSHHIIYDGWSLSILMGEFLSTYEILSSGNEPEKTEEDKFEDYIRYIEQINKDEQEKYWRSYMQGVSQRTLLPFIGATTQRTKGIGSFETASLKLDEKTTEQIESFAQKNRLTVNTVFQGVWSYLLHQYTGNDNIVYGVIVSGRPDDLPGVEQRVGMYLNTLPLHSTFSGKETIVEWLQEIQKYQVSSRQYQYTSLPEIQVLTGVSGDLFDSILVFENYPISEVIGAKEWKLKVENVQIEDQTNYPLTIIVGGAKELLISFNYNAGILKKEFIDEIISHFENVLLQLIKNEIKNFGEIELLTKAEKNRLMVEFNNESVEYPKDKSIVDLFEEQVSKTPDAVALVYEDTKLTYKELNEQSNRLAHFLKSKGVTADKLIPVCTDRSFGMIIGILGILKAGGAYVPVDPDYPSDRINFMIKDSGSDIVLSSSEIKSKLRTEEGVNIIELDGALPDIAKHPSDNIQTAIDPHNLAYVIYTSGSTGVPKGVMIDHSNAVRLFRTGSPLFDFNDKDVWTMFHSFCFDFSVWEMYGALLNGGRLVIVSKDATKDVTLFAELLISEKVTVLNQTPSSFYALQEFFIEKEEPLPELRYIIFGGEALNPSKLKLWKKLNPDCRLINMYGITETTVHVTFKEIGPEEIESGRSIIGKPIPTLSLFILDKNQKLLPVGVAGEICVGGAGLARGYLNLPELTEEKFIKNPFNEEIKSRLYRSGDLGIRLPDGNIEYLGRIDDQIKIRGYRIELGEIENVLKLSHLVNECIILAKEDKNGNKYLAGYVVAGEKFDKEAIVAYLRSKLPEYMIPAVWVELESLPLTANGKTDKKALPDPDAAGGITKQFVEPRNETEKKLAEIWRELLGKEKIGIYDNFFELGGHSLMATRVASSIRKEFSLSIPIKTLFEFSCIADIGNYIELINANNDKTSVKESFDL